MKRPPERWSSVIAAIAIAVGVRADSWQIDVPSLMRDGRRAPPRERRRARRSRTPPRSSTSRSRAARPRPAPRARRPAGPRPSTRSCIRASWARTVASAHERAARRVARPATKKAFASTGSRRRRARRRCSSCATASRRPRCRASRSSSATVTAIPSCTDGERQAELLADRLEREQIDAIYVTTLRRTHETAAPLARRLGITPVEEPDLREVFLGEWEGGLFRRRRSTEDPRVHGDLPPGALGRHSRRRAARRVRRPGLGGVPTRSSPRIPTRR